MIMDDNFLTEKEILDLQNLMYADPNSRFPWFYASSTNEDKKDGGVIDDSKAKDSPQFVHLGMINGEKLSPFAEEGINLLTKFCQKNNIKVENVIRIKSNLITKDQDNKEYHLPHIDFDSPHLVFLYYVNDSDGDTVFFNERYSSWGKFDSDTIHTAGRVSPKAGRAVVFDGLQYHASSSPQDHNFRCVININFTGKI